MDMIPLRPKVIGEVEYVINKLTDPLYMGGLLYVVCGANLRGGAVIRKTLEPLGFPCRHLRFNRDNAEKADQWLKELRERSNLAEGAKEAFHDILWLMSLVEDNAIKQERG
jgi:heme oxygenase